MPRPIGWKPLNYTTIATICGRIVSGDPPGAIMRDCRITKPALRSMRRAMLAVGVEIKNLERTIPPAVGDEVERLIKTTRLTNYEIARAVGLNGTSVPRLRRRVYYRELELAGLPLPRCECGDVFQHSHRCRYWKGFRYRQITDVDASEADEIRRELRRGRSSDEIRADHEISCQALHAIQESLSKRHRAERRRNLKSPRALQRAREDARRSGSDLLAFFRNRMPAGLERHVADEACAEMAFVVCDGRMDRAEAVRRKREFIAAAYEETGNRKNVSEAGAANGEAMSLLDLIEDETALEAFDFVEFSRRN